MMDNHISTFQLGFGNYFSLFLLKEGALMTIFTIEVEETTANFIQYLADAFGYSKEKILEDIIFNQVNELHSIFEKICVYRE
jgi:hypothetical protein